MEHVINYLIVCEYIGTAAFAISGAITAIKHKLDLLGIVVIGSVTGIGGGILRDEIISDSAPVAFVHLQYVAITILTSLLIYVFYLLKVKKKITWSITQTKIFDICDAIGLGIFAVNGTNAAMDGNTFTAILMGVITAVGGGILRDILCGEIPRVFKEEIYATAALVGSTCYYMMKIMGFNYVFASLVGMTLVVVIRLVSKYNRWKLPGVN